MPQLALAVLGAPRLTSDGVLVALDTRKAIALIAYLAAQEQRQHRDTLAALLWPEYDQSHARSSLRRTLSALHKALGGAWLHIERDSIDLTAQGGTCDLWDFQQSLAAWHAHRHPTPETTCNACLEHLTNAAHLYRGDFLAGFSLRDSVEFDDWQFAQNEALRRDGAPALEALAYALAARDDFAPAIQYARRWLALDRLSESAHQCLMRLYAWSGQRSAALRHYRLCVQMLEQEMGIAPSATTTGLKEQIQANHLPPPTPYQPATEIPFEPLPPISPLRQPGMSAPRMISPSPSADGEGAGGWGHLPLVGRAAEWAALSDAYRTIGLDGRVVLLTGEAGIGKTRLAEEFIAQIKQAGAPVLTARCYPGEAHLAYGSLTTALREAVTQPAIQAKWEILAPAWQHELGRLLPEYASTPPTALEGSTAHARFLEGMRQSCMALLATTPAEPPGILFVDDAQWADDATLEFLAYCARRLSGQRVCMLLAWRAAAITPQHPLWALQHDLSRTAVATTIALTRLDLAAIQDLAQAFTDALEHTLLARLQQETTGNPFFVIAYLTAWREQRLVNEAGEWVMPNDVRAVLRSQMQSLAAPGRQIISAVAVMGSACDLPMLCAMLGQDEWTTLAALEEAVQHGVLREVALHPPLYECAHETVRTFAYDDLSAARRALLHRQAAITLAERPDAHGAHASRIAAHFAEAGLDAQAADYYYAAGVHAAALFANTDAVVLLRRALALGYPDSHTANVALGDVLMMQSEYAQALAAYAQAGENAHIHRQIGEIHARRGAWGAANDHHAQALALLATDDHRERARVYAAWSRVAFAQSQLAAAIDLATHSLAEAEVATDDTALALAHNMLGALAGAQARLDDARHHLDLSYTFATRTGDPALRAATLNNLAQVWRAAGEMTRARELTAAALDLALAQGDRHHAAALHNNLADIYQALGETDAALVHVKAAVAIFADIGVAAGALEPQIWRLAVW